MKPIGAPNCPSIEYQPRRGPGALSASSDGNPSHEPPRPNPCPIRKSASKATAQPPASTADGRNAMPAVDVPSTNSAIVNLAARPQRRWIAIDTIVPIGRAMNASAKIANAYSVPSSFASYGKNTDGNTSTDAMPYAKKSKYSDARPTTTPTAMSPGATSSWWTLRWSGSALGTVGVLRLVIGLKGGAKEKRRTAGATRGRRIGRMDQRLPRVSPIAAIGYRTKRPIAL